MQSKPYGPVSLAALVAFGFLVAAPLRAQTVLSGDHVIAGGLVVDGNASAEHVSSVSTQGDAAFYGRQVGGAFANAQPIFSAVADNTNGAANWFFRGKKGGDNGTETFSVRADGVIKSAALAPGGTANVLMAVAPDGTLVNANSVSTLYAGTQLLTGGLSAKGPLIWGSDGGNIATISAGHGGMAGGMTNENGTILSSAFGAVAMGYALGDASIAASGEGSLALGYNNGSVGIKSMSTASFAVGYAGYESGTGIISNGVGSVAMGVAANTNLVSSGLASFALGKDVQATADNAFALGSSFNNSTPSTFKVGFSSTPTLTVTATQVGIGTIAPTERIEVAGNAKISGTVTAAAVTTNAITVNTVTVKTVLRVPQSGDLSMGSFMAGSNPAN